MVAGTLAILCGIMLLQCLPQLPAAPWLALLLPLALLPWLPAARRHHGHLLACVVIGFLWAWAQVAYLLRDSLSTVDEGVDLVAVGVVTTIPEPDAQRLRFVFDCEQLRRGETVLPCPGLLRLAWYRTDVELRAGQRWQLQLRLKRPHGMANPGSFDYEGWLFQHGIRATGYVREGKQTRLLAQDSGRYRLQVLRQSLYSRLQPLVGEAPMAGLITALAMGERQGISQEQWQTLRITGTNHLVAISGLHIGLVAGLAFFLWRWLWGCSLRASLRLPAPKAGAMAALLAALAYAALAGFSIPTQRALLMITVVMLAVLLQRAPRPAHILAIALAAVLLYDPLAVLAAGFWLSFGAVALLLYGMGGRTGTGNWWWRWGRAQWLVALGLAPVLALWFQQVPLLGALSNLLAVPWVTLVVVPLVLAAVAVLAWWPALAALLLQLALYACDGLWWWLQWSASLLPPQWGLLAPPGWTLAPALLGLAWLLAPRGWPARWLGGVCLLPLVLCRPPAPGAGELWLTQLDVGQGLSAVLRTANHTLLFDTGPRLGETLDAGEAVIVPYLRQQGVSTVDTLILSHSDIDHVGGTPAVMSAFHVPRVLASGELPQFQPEACRQGQQWAWDGVAFELLHPSQTEPGRYSDNNGSCVLRVSSAGGTVLLAADIEAPAEAELLASHVARLRADVLLVPHHGSRSSSSPAFVQAVAPRYALLATGYRNRYHFPHPSVVARYRAQGAEVLDSARHGALTLRFGRTAITVERWRDRGRRYWHGD